MKFRIHSHSDQSVLRAVQQNDPAGWERFCSRFEPVILSVLNWPRWSFSEHEVQDVKQDVYLQLQKALPAFRGDSSLRWFVIRIAHKQCVNEVRRQIRQRTYMLSSSQKTEPDEISEEQHACPRTLDPYREMLRTERKQAVFSGLDRLHKTCRSAINLFYIEGLSYQDISEQLGITVNTVGSRLSKCLDKLHKDLCKHPLFERKTV